MKSANGAEPRWRSTELGDAELAERAGRTALHRPVVLLVSAGRQPSQRAPPRAMLDAGATGLGLSATRAVLDGLS